MILSKKSPRYFKGNDVPNYDFIANCMHCGLCLPHCPTYFMTGLERSSPRGRIRMIKSVADADLPVSDLFVREMNFCLDCQACETVCPAGVKYGALVESARAQILEGGFEGKLSTWIKRFFFRFIFVRPNRLLTVASLFRLYQRTGLNRIVETSGILKLFSRRLHQIQFLFPVISKIPSSEVLFERMLPIGKPRLKVGFLTGCIMDISFADVNIDTVQLLLHHGCEVVIPHGQTCCGSLQAHNGDMSIGRRMARQNVAAFERENLDAIIMNSSGCGAFMKEYGHILADDPDYADRAKRMSKKVKDITEFLVEIGLIVGTSPDKKLAAKRVTYHDACHLIHTQKVSQQPRILIRSIPFIEFIELPESTWCCGSAGIYNITHYDDSMQLLKRKMENMKKINPDVLVSGNPGCLIQIKHGLQREGMNVELLHTATFLRRVCGA